MAYTEGSVQRAWELERNVVKQTRKLKTINDISLSFAKNPLTNDVLIKDNTGAIVQGIKFLMKTSSRSPSSIEISRIFKFFCLR